MKKRYMNLVKYSLDCIIRYKLRTMVIIVCLGVSASVFSSIAFLKDGLIKEGALSLKYSPDIMVQGIQSGRITTTETANIGYIQEAPGVRAAEPRVWGYGNVGSFLIVIMGVDLQSKSLDISQVYPLEAGSFLDSESSNAVVLGKGVADLLGSKVGNIITILTESVEPRQYLVKGVFNSESSIYNADMIIMNIDEARAFFNIPEDQVTDIAVYLIDTNDVNIVAREISEVPNVRILTKDVLIKAQETTYGARSGFFSVMWYIVLLTVAIIAFNQTVVVGHESKFEVGLLKALGFSTTDIIQIRMTESVILGALAASIGITVGILYIKILNAPVLGDFMLGWAKLYPSFQLPVYINASTIIFTYIIVIMPLLFATVIPSWLNATVDPDLAMRGAKA